MDWLNILILITSLIALLIITYFGTIIIINGGIFRRHGEPPRERGYLPWFGDVVRYGKNPGKYLEGLREKYGEVFSTFILGKDMIHLTNIDDFGSVHRNTDLSFEPIIGAIERDALYIKDLELARSLHGETKRGYKTHLSGDALITLTNTSNEITNKYFYRNIEINRDWKKVELTGLISKFVYDVVTETIFGTGFSTPENYKAFMSYDGIFSLLSTGLPINWLPKITNLRDILFNAIGTTRNNVSSFISERRKLFQEKGVTEYDTKGSQLGVFWASLANTIPSTFWVIYYIFRDPDLLKIIRDEIGEKIRDVNNIQYEEIKALNKLEAVIFEVLRITTSSYSVREAVRDTKILLESGNTLLIKKGQRACLSAWLIHRNPDNYLNPETFIWDRFLEFKPDGKFIPFGGGVSMCPGRFVAQNEIKIFAIYLITRCDIKIVVDTPIIYDVQRFGIGVLPPGMPIPAYIRIHS